MNIIAKISILCFLVAHACFVAMLFFSAKLSNASDESFAQLFSIGFQVAFALGFLFTVYWVITFIVKKMKNALMRSAKGPD